VLRKGLIREKVVSRFGHPWLAVIALAGQADARAVVLEVRLSGELVAQGAAAVCAGGTAIIV
jgi:hypothetical protein